MKKSDILAFAFCVFCIIAVSILAITRDKLSFVTLALYAQSVFFVFQYLAVMVINYARYRANEKNIIQNFYRIVFVIYFIFEAFMIALFFDGYGYLDFKFVPKIQTGIAGILLYIIHIGYSILYIGGVYRTIFYKYDIDDLPINK